MFFSHFHRSETNAKQTREDKDSRKDYLQQDEDAKQAEAPLLDSVPNTKVKQPKKKKVSA